VARVVGRGWTPIPQKVQTVSESTEAGTNAIAFQYIREVMDINQRF